VLLGACPHGEALEIINISPAHVDKVIPSDQCTKIEGNVADMLFGHYP
jgi:hypothetical protein